VLNTIFSNELKDLAHFLHIASRKNSEEKQALKKHSESATLSVHMGFTIVHGLKKTGSQRADATRHCWREIADSCGAG
jgi:hypothetical protein